MDIRKNIIFGFIVIIVLLSTMGAFLIHSMQNLARETENIYKHPFTVSNASRDIKLYTMSIHCLMKDLDYVKYREEINDLMTEMERKEQLIYEKFTVISDRYLGRKEDVDNAALAFAEWNEERHKWILDELRGDAGAADVSIGNEDLFFRKVNTSTQKLTEFAMNKANEFYTKTLKKKKAVFVYTHNAFTDEHNRFTGHTELRCEKP